MDPKYPQINPLDCNRVSRNKYTIILILNIQLSKLNWDHFSVPFSLSSQQLWKRYNKTKTTLNRMLVCMYDPTTRTVVEVVSAILCFILLRFMIKPYKLTREGRYLGLPLGFGFLGVSYVLGAIAFSQTFLPNRELSYIQLLSRTFAYCFLVVTYYFSKKPSENYQ